MTKENSFQYSKRESFSNKKFIPSQTITEVEVRNKTKDSKNYITHTPFPREINKVVGRYGLPVMRPTQKNHKRISQDNQNKASYTIGTATLESSQFTLEQ